jgi:hypothetical protein
MNNVVNANAIVSRAVALNALSQNPNSYVRNSLQGDLAFRLFQAIVRYNRLTLPHQILLAFFRGSNHR